MSGRGGEEVGEGAGLYFTPCTSLIIMEGGWLICYALYFFNNYGRGMAGGGGGVGEGGKGAGWYFMPCTSLIIMEGGWLIFYALYFFNNYGRGLAYILCLVLL